MTALTRPASLMALVVLVVNDHWLKGAGLLPGWLTGKASDFAGLFLAPLVLGALGAIPARLADVSRGRLAAFTASATAMGFALVKLAPSVNQTVERIWGPMVLDPTDLVALPMCGLAAWFMVRSPANASGARGKAFQLASLVTTLLACAATSPAPSECHPTWRLLAPRLAIKTGFSWVKGR